MASNDTSDDNYFVRYFTSRADIAVEMYDRGFHLDAHVILGTALDALGEIWLCDFPAQREAICAEYRGKVPAQARMRLFVERFAAAAPYADTISVPTFATDLQRHVPEFGGEADALLHARVPAAAVGQLPRAYLDGNVSALLAECPRLKQYPAFTKLAAEYSYAALYYRYVRCPTVHFATTSTVHGFARGSEVSYMHYPTRLSIGFGVDVPANWVREGVRAYVECCDREKVAPAHDVRPEVQAEEALEKRWKPLAEVIAADVRKDGVA